MDRGRLPQHPMKMGVRRKRAVLAISGAIPAILDGLPDAMNMAWTPDAGSTMFAALIRKPAT
jgi:hypothetical protein